MNKKYAKAMDCPITATIDVIGGKWKPIILWVLMDGARRWGELHREIPGIALKVLSRQLKELEQDRIIRREVFAEVPPRVEYSLTARGESLRPVMKLLARWSEENLASCQLDPDGGVVAGFFPSADLSVDAGGL